MTCLLSCLITLGGYGHYDLCPGTVEVVYDTQKYNYVKLIQGPATVGHEVQIDIKIWQQVEKDLCKKEKK